MPTKAPAVTIAGYSHVAVMVDDLDAAITFYCDTLGFSKLPRPDFGNVADRGSVPALASALNDPEPLVRGHAAWALGRLGGTTAHAALEEALSREADAWVRDECGLALKACGPRAVPSAV